LARRSIVEAAKVVTEDEPQNRESPLPSHSERRQPRGELSDWQTSRQMGYVLKLPAANKWAPATI